MKKIYVKNMIAFLLLSICLYVSILCSSILSVMVSNVEPTESTEPEPPTEGPMPGETETPVPASAPTPAPAQRSFFNPAPGPVALSAPAPTHLVRQISTDGRCGDGIGNNAMCPGFQCCSAGRWCGGNQSSESGHCKYSDGSEGNMVFRGYFREFDGLG